MHSESLVYEITHYIFDNDDMYRRHYLPTYKHLQKNPKNHERVMEIVDNVCKKFATSNNVPYHSISPDVKKQVAINLYQEMINDETNRSSR